MDGPLARYHAVLSAVAEAGEGMHAADLARATGLPRSTAHRIATSLAEIGYLQLLSPGHFVLGAALDRILSKRLLAFQHTGTFVRALMSLTEKLGESAFCAKLDGGRIKIIDVLVPSGRDRAHIYPGVGERPFDRCSSSRAILAFREEREVDSWLDDDAKMQSTDRSALRALLAQVRQSGYAVCDGEIDEGIFSLACPIYLEPLGVMYSIGVTGPSARLKAHQIGELADIVSQASKEAAEAIVSEVNASSKTTSKT